MGGTAALIEIAGYVALLLWGLHMVQTGMVRRLMGTLLTSVEHTAALKAVFTALAGDPVIALALVWRRPDLPKPIGPRNTVAPARCISRALSTIASYGGRCPCLLSSPKKTLSSTASQYLHGSLLSPWH
jgi:hypothetical protein